MRARRPSTRAGGPDRFSWDAPRRAWHGPIGVMMIAGPCVRLGEARMEQPGGALVEMLREPATLSAASSLFRRQSATDLQAN